jgi:hypothetical protein
MGVMKLSSIANLLAGNLPASEFSTSIEDELRAHLRALDKRGTSAPVALTEDVDIVLDRPRLGVLCRLFAFGHLSATELAYVADGLQLSDRVTFADPSIADDLSECTDPEINGSLSVARALEIAGTNAVA